MLLWCNKKCKTRVNDDKHNSCISPQTTVTYDNKNNWSDIKSQLPI